MKLQVDHIQGDQIRRVLRLIVALMQGSVEQADAIRLDTSTNFLADLSMLDKLPGFGVTTQRSGQKLSDPKLDLVLSKSTSYDQVNWAWNIAKPVYSGVETDPQGISFIALFREGEPDLTLIINIDNGASSDLRDNARDLLFGPVNLRDKTI